MAEGCGRVFALAEAELQGAQEVVHGGGEASTQEFNLELAQRIEEGDEAIVGAGSRVAFLFEDENDAGEGKILQQGSALPPGVKSVKKGVKVVGEKVL